MILEDYLERNARLYPQKTAIVCGELRCTYKELYARVCERAEDPDRQRCQTAVCLRAECSIDYLVTYFALHRAGCVVVPLEKDIPEDTFQELSQHFSASSVPENIADILYTTGTTGKSKGVMISHQTIIADAENLISGQGFTHYLAFIVNGPLSHIGSLSKIYPVIMLGATLILVDGMKDLNAFWKAFDYPALKVATFLD